VLSKYDTEKGGGSAVDPEDVEWAVYKINETTMLYEQDASDPVAFPDTERRVLVLWPGPAPASFDPQVDGGMSTGSLSIGDGYAIGPWLTGLSQPGAGAFDLTQYHVAGYDGYPLLMIAGNLGAQYGHTGTGTYRLALSSDEAATDTTVDVSVDYVVTATPIIVTVTFIKWLTAHLELENLLQGQSVTVDWGDGTVETDPEYANVGHAYAAAGTYTITVTQGEKTGELVAVIPTPGLSTPLYDLDMNNVFTRLDDKPEPVNVPTIDHRKYGSVYGSSTTPDPNDQSTNQQIMTVGELETLFPGGTFTMTPAAGPNRAATLSLITFTYMAGIYGSDFPCSLGGDGWNGPTDANGLCTWVFGVYSDAAGTAVLAETVTTLKMV